MVGDSRTAGSQKLRRRRRRRKKSPSHEQNMTLADAIADELEKRRRAVTCKDLLTSLQKRGYVGHNFAESALLLAARSENASRASLGRRPRFVLDMDGGIELADLVLDARTLALEKQLYDIVEKLRKIARTQLADQISRLPLDAIVPMAIACVRQSGFGYDGHQRVISEHEVHLRFNSDSLQMESLAVMLLRSTKAAPGFLGRRIAELRGSLYELGAKRGLVITPVRIPVNLRESSISPGAASVDVWDSLDLASRLEAMGYGLDVVDVKVPFVNTKFLTNNKK